MLLSKHFEGASQSVHPTTLDSDCIFSLFLSKDSLEEADLGEGDMLCSEHVDVPSVCTLTTCEFDSDFLLDLSGDCFEEVDMLVSRHFGGPSQSWRSLVVLDSGSDFLLLFSDDCLEGADLLHSGLSDSKFSRLTLADEMLEIEPGLPGKQIRPCCMIRIILDIRFIRVRPYFILVPLPRRICATFVDFLEGDDLLLSGTFDGSLQSFGSLLTLESFSSVSLTPSDIDESEKDSALSSGGQSAIAGGEVEGYVSFASLSPVSKCECSTTLGSSA